MSGMWFRSVPAPAFRLTDARLKTEQPGSGMTDEFVDNILFPAMMDMAVGR